jgi:uncharacterized protein involved in exopolysaccharide biosynthesis
MTVGSRGQGNLSMNQKIRNIETTDDEISLWELLDQTRKGWQWLAGSVAVGLVGALGFVLISPDQYEAKAVIQSQTFSIIFTTTIIKTDLEPVAQTVERLRLATFYNDEMVKVCGVGSAKDLADKVKVNLIKGSNIFSINYQAESAALAKTCVSKILQKLTQSVSEAAAPLINEFQDQLTYTKQQIDEVERFLAQSEKRVTLSIGSNELLLIIILKREELAKLQRLYREQRIQLTEPLMHPMKLLEPIYVSQKPVAPKKLLVVTAGLIGGLFAGLIGLFISRSWRRYTALST